MKSPLLHRHRSPKVHRNRRRAPLRRRAYAARGLPLTSDPQTRPRRCHSRPCTGSPRLPTGPLGRAPTRQTPLEPITKLVGGMAKSLRALPAPPPPAARRNARRGPLPPPHRTPRSVALGALQRCAARSEGHFEGSVDDRVRDPQCVGGVFGQQLERDAVRAYRTLHGGRGERTCVCSPPPARGSTPRPVEVRAACLPTCTPRACALTRWRWA